MRASGFQTETEFGVLCERFAHFVVRDRRLPVAHDRELQTVVRIAADRTVDRARADVPERRKPAPRYSRSIARDFIAFPSADSVASFLATTSRPDVSRSRRCTRPGRSASPGSAPCRCPSSALTSVPLRAAVRRMRDHAGRFVHDDEIVVFVTRSVRRWLPAARPSGVGAADVEFERRRPLPAGGRLSRARR